MGPDSDISCDGDFQPKPEMGSYKWNGVRTYDAEVEYTCSPYGRHGCQMAIVRFLDRSLSWPFGLLDYGSATLRCKI